MYPYYYIMREIRRFAGSPSFAALGELLVGRQLHSSPWCYGYAVVGGSRLRAPGTDSLSLRIVQAWTENLEPGFCEHAWMGIEDPKRGELRKRGGMSVHVKAHTKREWSYLTWADP